jgi:nickel-dependent lactate racemase/N-acetylglutamate synthase-like GNAT family acetyltransferase
MRFQIPCGKSCVEIDVPADALIPVAPFREAEPVVDATASVRAVLERPIGSSPLSEIALGKRSAVIVISDITRPVPNTVILPPILETIERTGIRREATTILIATGLHREATEHEVRALVGHIARDYRVISHNARKSESLGYVGQSSAGAPIWLNRAYIDADLKIVTGLIEPHFMAGFSGGRKGVCPGVAGAETICAFHSAELMDHPESDTAKLAGNPVHAMSEEIAERAGIDFLLNVTVDRERRVTGVFAGDWKQAFHAGAEHARQCLTRTYSEPADLVITSAGGWPLDATFYQSVKGMYAAAALARPGGAILVIAGCEEGIGSPEYAGLMRDALSQEDFALQIRKPGQFTIDQWQVQKHHQAGRRARILFHTPGLKDEPLAGCLVESVSDPQAVVEEYLRATARPRIAVMVEGPYVIAEVGTNRQSIIVREAEAADHVAIHEVSGLAVQALRRIYQPTGSPSDQPRVALAGRLVAEIDGEIVGTVGYRLGNDLLHIIGLMVHPDHWRQGVARRLIESLLQIAGTNGLRSLSLFTVKETGNVPIFERLGFKVITECEAADLQSVSGAALTEAYMEMRLETFSTGV